MRFPSRFSPQRRNPLFSASRTMSLLRMYPCLTETTRQIRSKRVSSGGKAGPLAATAGTAVGILLASSTGLPPAKASLNCFRFANLLACVAINANTAEANFTWKRDGSTEWGPWGTMGGRFSSTVSCVANSDGFECFGRGDNGHLFARSYAASRADTIVDRFSPPNGVWRDLGAPPRNGMGGTGEIVGDPSCVRIHDYLSCFTATEDGNFSRIDKSTPPPTLGTFRPWIWLGRPNLASSPACVVRPLPRLDDSQIVCIGQTTDSIAYRSFSSSGEPTADWNFISLASLGLEFLRNRSTPIQCTASSSGAIACVLPNVVGAEGNLIEFSSPPSMAVSRVSTPRRVDECFYSGISTLSCISLGPASRPIRSRLAPGALNRLADGSWTFAGSLFSPPSPLTSGTAECVSVRGGSSTSTQAECIISLFTNSGLAYPMDNVAYTMGTWVRLTRSGPLTGPSGSVPGVVPFALCHPARLPDVPRVLNCL